MILDKITLFQNLLKEKKQDEKFHVFRGAKLQLTLLQHKSILIILQKINFK